MDDGGVEDDQKLVRQVELTHLTQKVQPLLALPPDKVFVGYPLQVPGNCGSQELEGFHTGQFSVEDC